MLDEAKKREKVANAFLAATMAASAAQSPKDFVRTGHIEAPGTALMQMWAKKRGEAERNLDHGRVVPRNVKRRTFKEFVEETNLTEAQRHFSSRAELEKHHGGIPSGFYANNAGSSENPKWRLKPKSGGVQERERRKERIASLSSESEREAADRKASKIKSRGYEAHHITPTHHSAKLKASMSPAEWEARKARDAKIGVYHGHQPRNLMATKRSGDRPDKPGVYHRKGGAHEVEGKVKDIVSGPGSKESAISHSQLLAAAVRKQRREKRQEGSNK
jgi:hypothetical protein